MLTYYSGTSDEFKKPIEIFFGIGNLKTLRMVQFCLTSYLEVIKVLEVL